MENLTTSMLSIALLFLVSIALVPIWAISRYFKDERQLRRFPSPSIAGLTPLWGMWQSLKGTQTIQVFKEHERLGPVVRIAPNHISFTDPAAYKDIYGYSVPIIKGDFYALVSEGNPSLAQATDKTVHSAKRRAMAHVFSAKEITSMEPRVVATATDLCAAIKTKIGGGTLGPGDQYHTISVNGDSAIFDLRPWLNMFSYDAISSMAFSNSFGFLKRGNDICSSINERDEEIFVHAMDSYHSGNQYNTLTAQLPPPLYRLCRKVLFWMHGNKAGGYFAGMSRSQVQHRLKNKPTERDLFSSLPIKPTEKRPVPMDEAELIAECATMLDAGNDTTQSTLAGCIFHLASNPEKQQKLFDALTVGLGIFNGKTKKGNGVFVPSYKELQHIGYLRAVLDENWRCRPPLARGLPRITVGQGATIAGHFIPPGVTVSATVYAIQHDKNLFRRPLEFIPERWIPEEDFGEDQIEAKNLKDYCIPFSIGPRACIGRNLAYMEVSIAIAALVLNFEWELAEKGADMPMFERFNYNPKELIVKGKLRKSTKELV